MRQEVTVLVATMNQNSYDLLDKMNIQTRCVVGNQCNLNKIDEFYHKGREIIWVSTKTRGVGVNRNLAILLSNIKNHDGIVLFADDDMIFDDGYEQLVLEVFDKNPEADIVIFNLRERNPMRKQTVKVHYTKKIGYGAARIACRSKAIIQNGLFFHLSFGGGTEHSCGEDTIFLSECLRKKLKILCVPESIAKLTDERSSTWFSGFTKKYYFDKGFLFSYCKLSFIYLRILKFAYNESKKGRGSFIVIFKFLFLGIRAQKNM